MQKQKLVQCSFPLKTLSVILRKWDTWICVLETYFAHVLLFCKRAINYCKLYILNCRKGMYLLNTFRLIAGLLSLCLFLTINMLLRNWYFCGQTCFTAPFFMRFSTSNETVAFSWFEKFISFGSLFCFGLQKHGIRYPCLSRKYSDLLSVFPSCPESALPPLPVVKFESLYDCCTLFWNWNHSLFLWS